MAKKFHFITENPERVNGRILLATRVTNQNTDFASSCQLAEPAIINYILCLYKEFFH